MTLSSAASTGDQLKALTELRDDLANRLEVCSSDQSYATMARVFIDTLDKIAVIQGTEIGTGGTALDELAKRRSAAGRPNATNTTRATRSAK